MRPGWIQESDLETLQTCPGELQESSLGEYSRQQIHPGKIQESDPRTLQTHPDRIQESDLVLLVFNGYTLARYRNLILKLFRHTLARYRNLIW